MTVYRFTGDQARSFPGLCYADTNSGVHLPPGATVVSDAELEAQWFRPVGGEPEVWVRTVRVAGEPVAPEVSPEGDEPSDGAAEDIEEAPAEPTEIEGD